jgi:hypothetical protein
VNDYLGYTRRHGDFNPPLGGAPWREGFAEFLSGFLDEAREKFEKKMSLRSTYGTQYSPEDDIFHQASALGTAWRISRRTASVQAAGMFEVRLLSAVLVAKHNIVWAMQEAAEGREARPAESFLHDLQTASRILAAYTGADDEEIQYRAHDQLDLMEYLRTCRSLLDPA